MTAEDPRSSALPYLVDVHGPGVRRSLAELSRIADRSFRMLGHVQFDDAGPDRMRLRFEREAIAQRICDDGVLALSSELRQGFEQLMQELGEGGLQATLTEAWQIPR